MKYADIVDAKTASALQTAWLHAALEPVSEFGRRAYAQLRPYRPGQEMQARQRACEIADLSAGDIDAIRETLACAPDPLPAISAAAMGNDLEDAHLLELLRFLDAAHRVDPSRASSALTDLAALLESGRAGKTGFYLSEKFDPVLAKARTAAERAQTEYEAARERLARAAAAALGRGQLPCGEFIVMRDSVERLPAGMRIVREAPTYFLCELEMDEAALNALRKRDEAEEAAAHAERSVRAHISRSVRRCVSELERLLAALADLDVRVAQACFARDYACVPPQVLELPAVVFEDASYLPMREELQAQGRSYEPISIALHEVAVLTGPNMAGKTVALRTCGFIALLTAFGIPVPAKSAQCALFDDIAWLGIGSEPQSEELLSSFAAEVVRLQEILSRPASHSLLLVDEFARTTTPHEGKALLVALLKMLRSRGSTAFAVTHLAGIARDAQARHFAVRGLRDVSGEQPATDLPAALAALAKSMDYSIVEVRGDEQREAGALALARLLGLNGEVVAEAARLMRAETEQPWIR